MITRIEDKEFNRLFAIGDVHGCNNELKVILDYLENELGFTPDDQLIFIGDYIDRGDDSPGVLTRIMEWKDKYNKTLFLKGNHEAMLLDFKGCSGGMHGEYFLINGGDITLRQWIENKIDPEIILKQIKFIEDTKWIIETDGFYFVHAGFFPGILPQNQIDEDLIWLRQPFLRGEYDFGKTVVHGHTVTKDLIWLKDKGNQINIDLGCVYHGTYAENGRLCLLNCNEMIGYTVQKGSNEVLSNYLV